jgi:hypothetical protein
MEDGEWKMAILDPPFSILDLANASLASEVFLSSLKAVFQRSVRKRFKFDRQSMASSPVSNSSSRTTAFFASFKLCSISAPEERIERLPILQTRYAGLQGWCDAIRAKAQTIYPSEVHLVDNQAELLAHVAGARVIVVEELTVGEQELAKAGSPLKFVQKYGFTTRNIDSLACEAAGVKVLTIRRRANISTTEQGLTLMLGLARQLTRNANLISVEQLKNAGYSPTTYDRSHTPNGNWARIREW